MSGYTSSAQIEEKYNLVLNGYRSGLTRDIEFRRQQLRNLFYSVKDHEQLMKQALYIDLHRPPEDTEMVEVNGLLGEIMVAIDNLEDWASDTPLPADIKFAMSSAVLKKEPYGVVLVIGPWNYPFYCTMIPLVAAVAAGNTVVVKPSEMVVESAKAMTLILEHAFDKSVVQVVNGAVPETTQVLNYKFDKIMFTGSCRVGQIISQAAAQHSVATPLVLELGGKSPAIITASANLKISAKRLAWAKYINAGQTCMAPDYAVVDRKIADKFIPLFQQAVNELYPDIATLQTEGRHFTHIVHDRMWDRLNSLVEESAKSKPVDAKWQLGVPNRETRFFPPTVICNVGIDDPLMREELFGPILPIMVVDNPVEEVPKMVQSYLDYPLALYIYSQDSSEVDYVINNTRSGAVLINDAILQSASPGIPFGGVGNSGMGRYRGKWGYDEFTHEKPVILQPPWIEKMIEARYTPYDTYKLRAFTFLTRPLGLTLARTGTVNGFWFKLNRLRQKFFSLFSEKRNWLLLLLALHAAESLRAKYL